jgi:hypothetical protein
MQIAFCIRGDSAVRERRMSLVGGQLDAGDRSTLAALKATTKTGKQNY